METDKRLIRDRRIYASFFYVTGFFYSTIALGTALSDRHDHLWPGRWAWVYLYFIAALMSVAAGVAAVKAVHGPRLWVRRAGLVITPMLLVFRGIVNFTANGPSNGLIGSAFLLWAAFAIGWAGYLLRHMPTTQFEWERMRDELLEVEAKLKDD